MATRTGKAKRPKPTTLHQATLLAPVDLSPYCKDLEDWPRSWMGLPEDLVAGQQIVDSFRPFLGYLIHLGLARKTIRKHLDNLWILGGEMIRELNESPSLRKRPVAELLFDAVDQGGLLPYQHDSEEQLRSFESTCRKFCRFLEQQRR